MLTLLVQGPHGENQGSQTEIESHMYATISGQIDPISNELFFFISVSFPTEVNTNI